MDPRPYNHFSLLWMAQLPSVGVPSTLGLPVHHEAESFIVPAVIFCKCSIAMAAAPFLFSDPDAPSMNSLKRERHFLTFSSFNRLIFVSSFSKFTILRDLVSQMIYRYFKGEPAVKISTANQKKWKSNHTGGAAVYKKGVTNKGLYSEGFQEITRRIK